jgi:hypothetical protein
MTRTYFVFALAGLASCFLPGIVSAAAPCPPPAVSAEDGTSSSTSCTTPSKTYSTEFLLVENPISEGGTWKRGTTSYWHDVRTVGGNAVASANAGPTMGVDYDDTYAFLTGTWGPDQEVEGTIYRGSASSGELELNLRVADTSTTVKLYECTVNIDGRAFFARWNGARGDFNMLKTANSIQGGFVDGDRIRARIVGQTISMWYARKASPTNWVLVATVTDDSGQKLTSGNPGIGFFARGTLSLDYGFKDVTARSF